MSRLPLLRPALGAAHRADPAPRRRERAHAIRLAGGDRDLRRPAQRPCPAGSATRSTGRAPATRWSSTPAATRPGRAGADGDRRPRRRGPGAAAADRARQPRRRVRRARRRHAAPSLAARHDAGAGHPGHGERPRRGSRDRLGRRRRRQGADLGRHDGAARQRRDRRGLRLRIRRAEAARGQRGRRSGALAVRNVTAHRPARERDPLRGRRRRRGHARQRHRARRRHRRGRAQRRRRLQREPLQPAPRGSPQLSLGAGIVSAEPRLADAAAGDYRPQHDSPTVDAGVADAFTSAARPRRPRADRARHRRLRVLRRGPWPGTPLTSRPSPARTSLPRPSEPARPRDPGAGARRDRRRGPRPRQGARAPARRPPLPQARRRRAAAERHRGRRPPRPHPPDHRARRGRRVPDRPLLGRRASRSARAARQRHDLADAARRRLRALPARSSALAHASAVPRENPTTRRVVRRLWARDRGGRFRTYGNNSVATARGTAWVTEDRCDGTRHARARGRRRGARTAARAGP